MKNKTNKNFKINQYLDIEHYLAIVSAIADDYFDDDGGYQPHIGQLNAMRIFYNVCVVKSKFDDAYTHDITDLTELNEIVTDKEFLDEFKQNCYIKYNEYFDFAHAYNDALCIVEYKKSHLNSIVDSIQRAINKINMNIGGFATDENIKSLSVIANAISDGTLNYDQIIDGYGKSDRFKRIISTASDQGDITETKE